ncbi:MAG: hypothetical protein WB771_03575 [Solirubrobacterales bacterium]
MKGCLNRSCAWLRMAAFCVSCLAAVLSAPTADASLTIGQLPSGRPTPSCTTSGIDYLQPSVTSGGNLYVAREAGTITSWSTSSSGAGAVYVLKVFRRTTDPDAFQVVAHTSPHVLSSGLNTVPVSVPVQPGDMLGYHESGPPNSCTFTELGDNVITRTGDLADGDSGVFAPENDARLNLSAELVPDNSFTLSGITRDRKRGIATITATTSNPGAVAIAGKRMKKRPPKNLGVAGRVSFTVVAAGKARHRLKRKGRLVVPLLVTYFPTAGEPSTQAINVKLKKIRKRKKIRPHPPAGR